MERPWATRTRKLGVSRETERYLEDVLKTEAGAWGAFRVSGRYLGYVLRD